MSDFDFAVTERGVLALQAKTVLDDRLQDRERDILTRAIREWHGGTLTGDNARAYLAAIAELRGLRADLDREVRSGREARERLTAPSPAGTAR